MPWYVELSTPANNPGAVTASVVEFANDAAFTKATNSTPNPAGGYPTKAAAQAAADKFNGQPAGSKTVGNSPNIPTGTAVNTPGFGLPSPFASIENALSAFYDKLTDGKMWRSLGWLALGILLMLLGLAMWIGPSAMRRSPLGMAREALG
jgi:hypothetical protein